MSEAQWKNRADPPRLVIAGSDGDPRSGYALCVTCSRTKILKFQPATGLWISPGGQTHSRHLIEPMNDSEAKQ
jgi:hypothetical protein